MSKLKNINKNLGAKIAAFALVGTISVTTLTGCNQQVFDTKLTFKKAIIFGDNTATIVEIKKWNDYDGEQFQLILEDGTVLVTSSFDTKLINEKDVSAEEVARCIKGNDVEIKYLGKDSIKKR